MNFKQGIGINFEKNVIYLLISDTKALFINFEDLSKIKFRIKI